MRRVNNKKGDKSVTISDEKQNVLPSNNDGENSGEVKSASHHQSIDTSSNDRSRSPPQNVNPQGTGYQKGKRQITACLVCGDASSQNHYGIASCNACANYFHKNVGLQMILRCIAGTDACIVDKDNRGKCKACRLKKCLDMGMEKRGENSGEVNSASHHKSIDTSSNDRSRSGSPTEKRQITDFICLICGDSASGNHYGITSCNGCGGFFNKTVGLQMNLRCIAGTDACVVDKDNRKKCKSCRLRKCLDMGMNIHGIIKITNCCVCGDSANRKNYGVMSCHGCAIFFRNSVKLQLVYRCTAETNACIVDKDNRNKCKACRMKKCLDMGMNIHAVQNVRQVIKPATLPPEAKCEMDHGTSLGSADDDNAGVIVTIDELAKSSTISYVKQPGSLSYNDGEKLISCPDCMEMFSNVSELKEHMEIEDCLKMVSEIVKCTLCSVSYFKNRKHNCVGRLYCLFCEQYFRQDQSELAIHHITNQVCLAIPRCNVCYEIFPDGGFQEHKTTNTCPNVFYHPSQISSKLGNTYEKWLSCNKCGYFNSSQSIFESHLNNCITISGVDGAHHHIDRAKYYTTFCQNCKLLQLNGSKHICKNDNKMSCSCGVTVKLNNDLLSHYFYKSCVDVFCQTCDLNYKTKKEYLDHLKSNPTCILNDSFHYVKRCLICLNYYYLTSSQIDTHVAECRKRKLDLGGGDLKKPRVCDKTSEVSKCLKKYIDKQNDTPQGFCCFCFKILFQGEIHEHLKICADLPVSNVYQCVFCKRYHTSPYLLYMHTHKSYLNLRNLQCFPCGHCAFLSPDRDAALKHVESKHDFSFSYYGPVKHNGYNCFVCGKNFGFEKMNARFHIRSCVETQSSHQIGESLHQRKPSSDSTLISNSNKKPRLDDTQSFSIVTNTPRLVLVKPDGSF